MMTGIKVQLGLALALGLSSIAQADQTFDLDTLLDLVDANPGDGVCETATTPPRCSLRAAIQEANAVTDGSTSTIKLQDSGEYYLDIAGALEDEARSGDLDIKTRVIINGPGSHLVAIDGGGDDRVFHIHPGANVTLNDLTIQNGHNVVVPADIESVVFVPQDINEFDGGGGIKIVSTEGAIAALTLNRVNVVSNAAGGIGGGIDSRSSKVTINASVISGNRVAGFGGGISNMNGQMIINDSTISSNRNSSAPDLIFGGGIFNSGEANSLEINRSTIADNSTFRDGAGIYHQIGDLKIVNSTISGNVAGRWGGGLFNGNATGLYKVELQNVTVTDNDADGNMNETSQDLGVPRERKGGGIYNRAYTDGAANLSLFNSLVVLNGRGSGGVFLGGDCFNDLTQPFKPFVVTKAHMTKTGTLVSDDTCLNVGEPAPAILTSVDINIGPLGDNGGATQTHALLEGSAAISHADNAHCPNHDQRKFGPRLSCDSGAYEFGAFDFGEPLVTPALPYSTPPLPAPSPVNPEPVNGLPQAFDLLTVVLPGESVTAEVAVVDQDGPDKIYEETFSPEPEQGTVEWVTDITAAPGTFTYTANNDASGVDTFGYRFCDGTECDSGTVTVVINDPAATTSTIGATVLAGSGTVGNVTVIPAELFARMSDPGFTYPLGAMFFDVTDIPTESGVNSATVTLTLPAGIEIAPNAVVRKMNQFGAWATLEIVANSRVSTGVFTPASGSTPATVTLVLRDNDQFDLNSLEGVISDPVAIAVSTAPAPGPSPGPPPAGRTDIVIEDGAGTTSLGYLSALLLFALYRRRFDAIQH